MSEAERGLQMKRMAMLLVLLAAILWGPAGNLRAQDLPDKPEPLAGAQASSRDSSGAVAQTPMSVPLLFGNEHIPPGMVWVPRGGVWHAEEVSSCNWCGRPMTFKQATFDRKMSLMWIGELALTTLDVELNRACVNSGRCREANPIFGDGNRTRAYGIRFPVIFGAWMISGHLRKGDTRLNMGGMKRWWILPLMYQGMSAGGVITGIHANLASAPAYSKARPAPEKQF